MFLVVQYVEQKLNKVREMKTFTNFPIILLIVLLVVKGWNRKHHGQTIHPTEKFTSMNLHRIL